MSDDDIVTRLRKRAEIRRQITTRKSVQEGKPDRIADLLEEAAKEIWILRTDVQWWKRKANEGIPDSSLDQDEVYPWRITCQD